MLHRQARLRAPYSTYYPGITPGEWHHAVWVREMTLSQLRKGGPRWEGEGRVLPDAHFEFQGGFARRGMPWDARRLLPRSATAD
ncbi:MAG TPA: hypothetical protein VFR62_03065 [Gemmatimonadales bacterium]|nr:hypothetical protein [Gemmatimonadales bacterium]